MPTIFIRMMLKVLGCKSPITYVYLLQRFRLRLYVSFFGSQTDYSLIVYYKGKSQFASSCCNLYLRRIS